MVHFPLSFSLLHSFFCVWLCVCVEARIEEEEDNVQWFLLLLLPPGYVRRPSFSSSSSYFSCCTCTDRRMDESSDPPLSSLLPPLQYVVPGKERGRHVCVRIPLSCSTGGGGGGRCRGGTKVGLSDTPTHPCYHGCSLPLSLSFLNLAKLFFVEIEFIFGGGGSREFVPLVG